MSKFYVGQEVRIFRNSNRGDSEGEKAHVVKVGRKLVTVQSEIYKYRTEQFRMEDGRLNEKMYGYGTWVRTLEEVAESKRLAAALETLKQAHVELKFGHGYKLAQIEKLAAVAAEIRKEQEQ